jgi:MFS family permease
MFLDRIALGFLAPFFAGDLTISNFQLGLLSSGFNLTFGASGYLIAALSDHAGRRRDFLVAATLVFSLLSGACGLATGFLPLLLLRLLLGIAEGPYLPIVQTVMIPASSTHRRGFNIGFLQNVAPFMLGQLAGPIVLMWFATRSDWRATFMLTALPGLAVLPFLWRLVPARSHAAGPAAHGMATGEAPVRLLAIRNVRLCVAMAACTGTWILLNNTFLPLYLVRVVGCSTMQMGFFMSMLGVGGCAASLVLPALSDRVGRRPVLLAGFALGLVTPLALLLGLRDRAALAVAIALGSCVLGCTPLTVTMVSSDSVRSRSLARAIGLSGASSAIVGGVLMPALAGRLADAHGLQVPIRMTLAAAAIGVAIACFLERIPPARRMSVLESAAAAGA